MSSNQADGVTPVLALANIMKGSTEPVTAAGIKQALATDKNVVIPLSGGLTFTCNGTAIPLLKSVCSSSAAIGMIQAGKSGNVTASRSTTRRHCSRATDEGVFGKRAPQGLSGLLLGRSHRLVTSAKATASSTPGVEYWVERRRRLHRPRFQAQRPLAEGANVLRHVGLRRCHPAGVEACRSPDDRLDQRGIGDGIGQRKGSVGRAFRQ